MLYEKWKQKGKTPKKTRIFATSLTFVKEIINIIAELLNWVTQYAYILIKVHSTG